MHEIKTWTGERLETFVFNDNTVEHLHRYAITIEYIKGKTVLDIASGEGYGSKLLSKYAEKVFGVDIDETSIKAAKEKYNSKNLEFKIGRADLIPLEDNSIDIVISFETLEHHDKHHEMIREIKRVLKANGVLIMSTPDKKYYSDVTKFKNQFHIKELYEKEFKELINEYFKNAQFYFQNMFKGSLIIPEQNNFNFKSFEGDFDTINFESFVPKYIITIACDGILPDKINLSCFDGQSIVLKEQEDLINNIKKNVREETTSWIKNSWSFRVGNALLHPLKFLKRK